LLLGLAACDRSSATPTAPSAPESVHADIRIKLAQDDASGATTYQVDTLAPGNGASLEPALRAARKSWARSHREPPTVSIEAVQTIPWSDVIVAFDACEKLGLSKIEFIFPRARKN
jgi:hypothetical protein